MLVLMAADLVLFNFTPGTSNLKLKCYERSYGILGKPAVLYCTMCITWTAIIYSVVPFTTQFTFMSSIIRTLKASSSLTLMLLPVSFLII